MHLAVIGTDTGVGKTLVSAILAHMLHRTYWKPLSCAPSGEDDTTQVANLGLPTLPAVYSFPDPLSPHIAAPRAGQTIELEKLDPPAASLLIEGIGGLMCPLTDKLTCLDLLTQWRCACIVVSRHRLGSLNHTLLTVETLRTHNIPTLGLIFNGEELPDSERFLLHQTRLPHLGTLDLEPRIDLSTIQRYSEKWKINPTWKQLRASLDATEPTPGTPTCKPRQLPSPSPSSELVAPN